MKSQTTRNSWSKQSGFSLVELMVVVAIIGVLASLAVPRFKTFQAKARQAEAKTNLAHLYTLQQSFHADYDTYAGSSGSATDCSGSGMVDVKTKGFECSANCLGFIVKPCNIETHYNKNKRYTYQVMEATQTTFKAQGFSQGKETNRVLPGCDEDVWSINEKKSVKGEKDQTRLCAN